MPVRGLTDARAVDGGTIVDLVGAAGLRGRGGAGFPVGRKWRTVISNTSPVMRPTVVVNAAEGEPGCLKDREILLRDPYRVLEGALIAAHAVGADSVIIATKAAFTGVVRRLEAAIAEIDAAGLDLDGAGLGGHRSRRSTSSERRPRCSRSIDGRPPFPRIAPPYREGVDEMFEHADDVDTGGQLRRARRDGRPGPRVDRAADAGRQRRDVRQRARHRALRRRLVPGGRHRRVAGHGRVHGDRRHRPRRGRRGRARDAVARGHRTHRWWRAARPRDRRGHVGGGEPAAAGCRARHADDLRGPARRGWRARRRRVHRVRRHDRPGRGRRRRGPLPRGRVVRAVPPLQGRRAAARRAPGQAGGIGRHRRATSTRSAVASTSSPKVRGATWRRSNRS